MLSSPRHERKTPREWIIHDGVFPKRACSVDAQRQFACAAQDQRQVAVVASALTSAEYIPLAARLYLPSYWLRNQEDVAATTVPEAHRHSIGKAEIAAQLLAELLDEEPLPTRVLAEDSYAGAGGLGELLAARGVSLVPASAASGDHVRQTLAHFERLKEDLGLDHFEGRSWQGWHHHVSIVMAAYGFVGSSGNAEIRVDYWRRTMREIRVGPDACHGLCLVCCWRPTGGRGRRPRGFCRSCRNRLPHDGTACLYARAKEQRQLVPSRRWGSSPLR